MRTPDSAMMGNEAATVKEWRVGNGESGSGSASFDMGRDAGRLAVADETTVELMLGAESASGSVGDDAAVGRPDRDLLWAGAWMLWVRCRSAQVSLGVSK